MENTAKDFWKMIMSYKVSAIVMCCGEQENGRVSIEECVSLLKGFHNMRYRRCVFLTGTKMRQFGLVILWLKSSQLLTRLGLYEGNFEYMMM